MMLLLHVHGLGKTDALAVVDTIVALLDIELISNNQLFCIVRENEILLDRVF